MMRGIRIKSSQDGFTIVELMVVLLIIGVLLGIAIPSFLFSMRSSKEAACKSNLKIIRTSLEEYHMDNKDYPDKLEDLVPGYLESETGTSCPETGQPYDYDPDTGEVKCPYHTCL
ncbi:MAG: prepilin-type N-terminal cleavage/methylation domain-containing protein [Actinomycetota bacterium]|nr:prepilin-type N-terminal cleavage/methylation domain-containing protein [Actinomycetota bacterium]